MIRKFVNYAQSVAILMLTATPLVAQFEEEEKKARWVIPYALVFLLLGLSLYSICRPSTRRNK